LENVALMDNVPRKASAAAIDCTTCWTVDRSNFVALVGSVKQALQESIGVLVLKNVNLMEGLNVYKLVVELCAGGLGLGRNPCLKYSLPSAGTTGAANTVSTIPLFFGWMYR
jgi:hypothetical protein